MQKFWQIMEAVDSTDGMRIPSAKHLLGRNEEIVAEEQLSDIKVTVFKSGFLICYKYSTTQSCGEDEKTKVYKTVWAIDRCKYMQFGDNRIYQKDFLDMDWFHPVSKICLDRIEENQEVEYQKHIAFSLDDESDMHSFDEYLSEPEPEYEFNEDSTDDKIENILKKLTPQQRQILEMNIVEKMKVGKIATALGVTKQQVSKQLIKAKSKVGIR